MLIGTFFFPFPCRVRRGLLRGGAGAASLLPCEARACIGSAVGGYMHPAASPAETVAGEALVKTRARAAQRQPMLEAAGAESSSAAASCDVTGMAERGGFEPPDEVSPVNCLAGSSFRPLRHLSGVLFCAGSDGYGLRGTGKWCRR